MDGPWILCADIGSVRANKFGWYGVQHEPEAHPECGTSINHLAETVADKLTSGSKVSLGFECPLFVPVREDSANLTRARLGEGPRSWSAGAGCGALATGLVEVVWILRAIRLGVPETVRAFLSWNEFEEAQSGLFLWEAFVSETAKGEGHIDDARIAVDRFRSVMPTPQDGNAIREESVLSLIGTALIRAGWSRDIALVFEPCLVIKA